MKARDGAAGLAPAEIAEMPANNLILAFEGTMSASSGDAWRGSVCVG